MRSKLFLAAVERNLDEIVRLLARGADVNNGDDGPHDVVTPLYVAARLEHYAVVRFLVLRGGHLGDLFPWDCTHLRTCTYRMNERIGRTLRSGPRLWAWRRAFKALFIVRHWSGRCSPHVGASSTESRSASSLSRKSGFSPRKRDNSRPSMSSVRILPGS